MKALDRQVKELRYGMPMSQTQRVWQADHAGRQVDALASASVRYASAASVGATSGGRGEKASGALCFGRFFFAVVRMAKIFN